MNYDDEFKRLYRELGLGENSNWKPLIESCIKNKDCWTALGDKIKLGSKYTISIPWVGSKYASTKILTLAINFNGYGGIDAYKEVIKNVIKDFSPPRPKRRTCSNNKYPGSLLHHRMASYCVAILDNIKPEGWKKSGASENFPDFPFLIDSFNYIAHTNLIKCSYDQDNGRPSDAMRENCPGLILKKELEILKPKPKILVFLGKFVGEYALKSLSADGKSNLPEYVSGFRFYTRRLEYSPEPIRCFDFCHPSYFRISAIEIYKRLIASLSG